MTKTIATSPEPGDEHVPSTDVATTETLDSAAPAAPSAAPTATPSAPAPVARSLSTPAIVGIAVGGVLVAGLLFGGGIAVGVALPVGGHSVADTHGGGGMGFPGGDRPGGPHQDGDSDRGARPGAPDSDTNRQGPAAPNSDDTDTDTEQG